MKSCNCKSGAINTGVPACIDIFNRTSYEIYMYRVASDGTLNSIKESDLVDGKLTTAFVTAKINETDPSKRWYVMPRVKNVTFEQADPNTEEIDGIPYPVSEGNITGTVDYVSKLASPKWYGVLKSFECLDVAKFEVTVAGELVGVEYDDELRPMPMEQGTMWLKYQKPTKTTVAKIMQTVVWKEDFPVERINFLPSDSIEEGALDSINGLQDIILEEAAAATTTSVTVDAELCYGGFANKLPAEGLVSADFNYDGVSTLYNVTDDASVPVLTVTENPEGRYVITFALQDSSDVIRVRVIKEGYFNESIDITIP